jgi:hypothetical protein
VRRALFALLAFFVVIPVLAFAQQAPPARPFQRCDGCIYKPQRWNDGDSFHVILPDRKEVIFRLYFVDTSNESCTVLGPDPKERAAIYYVGVKGVGTNNAYKLTVSIENK